MTRRACRLSVSWPALVLALIAPFAVALNKNDLYPYSIPGTSILQTDPNGLLLSAETILKTPIAFYDQIFNSIFVSRIHFFILRIGSSHFIISVSLLIRFDGFFLFLSLFLSFFFSNFNQADKSIEMEFRANNFCYAL